MTFLDMAIWAQQGTSPGPGGAPAGPSMGQVLLPVIIFTVIGLLGGVVAVVAQWKLFTKAGEPGWASLVPIYNAMVLSRICGRGEVFGLLLFIPCVGFIIAIMLALDLARVFGKGPGFGIGLLVPVVGFVLILMLAFGDAEYVGDRPTRGRRRLRDDDDDDRPRRRRVDDEDEDDRPRRRPVAEERVRRKPDEDDDDRPRRRPAARDDDDDDPPPRPRRPGPR